MKPTPRSRPIRSREISRPKKVDSSARRRSDLFGPFGSDSGQGYKQGASIVPPATLAAYKITRADVADLSQGFDPDIWDDTWQNGVVPGAKSPASRRKFHRPGSLRTLS